MTYMKTRAVFSYDTEANASYIKLHQKPGNPIRNTEETDAKVIVDYNANGELVGIEILWGETNFIPTQY